LAIVALGAVFKIWWGIYQLVWILVACAFYATTRVRDSRPTGTSLTRRAFGSFAAALGTSILLLWLHFFIFRWQSLEHPMMLDLTVLAVSAIYALFRVRPNHGLRARE
jgi:hypothetical protein